MTSRPCEHCGGELPLLANRDARFCSTRCRVAAHRARRQPIPAELRSQPRWIRHSAIKVPLTTTGRSASSTDAATWTTFAAASASHVGAGLGFVLNGDGIVCIDLDHCVDASGRIAEWAQQIVDASAGTYIEVSPSGAGLHVWGRGETRRGRRIRSEDRAIEVYGDGRYLTVTAQPTPGSSRRLVDLSAVLADLT